MDFFSFPIIRMDRQQKKELRDFLGVSTITEARRQLGLPANLTPERVYRYVERLYAPVRRERIVRETVRRNIIRQRIQEQERLKKERQKRTVEQIAIRRKVKRNSREFNVVPRFNEFEIQLNGFEYKQFLLRFKGRRVKVFTIKNGSVVHSAELFVPEKGFNKWWIKQGAFYFLEGDSPQETPLMNITDPAKVIITPQLDITANMVSQTFREGIRNCMFLPICNLATTKMNEAKSRTTKWRYSTLLKKARKLEEQYKDGVPENKIQQIANELQVNISVEMPFSNEPFINCKSDKMGLMNFKFVNTRMNHIDLNEVVDKNNFTESTHEELQYLAEKYIENGTYFDYLKNKKGEYIKIRTLTNQYCSKCEFLENFNQFEMETGLIDTKIDHINDEVAIFIHNGIHTNQNRLFQSLNQEIKHIDRKRSFANFHLCSDYIGFVGKITDFRKCDNFDKLGYYAVDTFDFSSCDPRVIKLKDMLGYLVEGNVYPSPELKKWEKLGVKIRVGCGCWGNDIDFRFPDYMLEKIEGENIRGYTKWCGINTTQNYNQSFYMRGDKNYFECMKAHLGGVAEVACFEDGEGFITYPKQNAFNNAHIVGFIIAYERMAVINQLLQMDLDKIIAVIHDGIYYQEHDYTMGEGFRVKEDITDKLHGSDCYCTNINFRGDEDEDYEKVDSSFWCENEPRKFGLVELFKGAGGNGKTHYNLKDAGLVRPIYIAPSWKLATAKARKYGVEANVIANLLHETKRFQYRRYNSCFIIDESSQISEETKLAIKSIYKGCKLIFCGDNGFQLPPNEGTEMSETGFDRIEEFKKNFRFTCDKHKYICEQVRGMIKAKDNKEKINKFIIDSYENIKEPTDYKPTDIILCSKTRCVVHKKDDCNCDGKNFCKKWTDMFGKNKWKCLERGKGFCNGDIVIGAKPKGVKSENRHGFTIHSVQGETFDEVIFIDARNLFDARMGYTAISRARRWEQIKIIV